MVATFCRSFDAAFEITSKNSSVLGTRKIAKNLIHRARRKEFK